MRVLTGLGTCVTPAVGQTNACGTIENCCDYSASMTCAPAAYSKDQVALLVGVDRYETNVTTLSYEDLKNAINDAREIGNIFRSFGVETRFVFNPDRLALDAELARLSSHLKARERVLRKTGYTQRPFAKLYFAGHGLRGLDKRDYLVLPIEDPDYSEIEDYLLATDAVALNFSGLRVFDFTFVFDACRTFVTLPDNTTNVGRGSGEAFGTTKFESVSQYMTVLSTAPGTAASDVAFDKDDLGLFARYFTFFLEKPGLKFVDIVDLTGWFVHAANPGQEPQVNASPSPGIRGRRFENPATDDVCALADEVLFTELKEAQACGTYSPGENPACVSTIATFLNETAKREGKDVSGLIEQCPALGQSLELIDPEKLTTTLAVSTNSLLPFDPINGRLSVNATFEAPIIRLSNFDSNSNTNLMWPDDSGDNPTASLYAYSGQQHGSGFSAGPTVPGFTPRSVLGGPEGVLTSDRLNALSAEISPYAGLPIDFSGDVKILNSPIQGSSRIYNRIPDGASARLDCVNLLCSGDYLGVSVYESGNDSEPTRGFVTTSDLVNLARPPANKQRLLVRFRDGALVPTDDGLTQLTTAVAAAPDEAIIALWVPPDDGSAQAFLQNRARATRLIEALEFAESGSTTLRNRISQFQLAESNFGGSAFIVEIISQ